MTAHDYAVRIVQAFLDGKGLCGYQTQTFQNIALSGAVWVTLAYLSTEEPGVSPWMETILAHANTKGKFLPGMKAWLAVRLSNQYGTWDQPYVDHTDYVAALEWTVS